MHLESVWAYLSVPDKKRYEMHRLKIWEGKVKDIIRKVMAYKFVTQFTAVEIRHPRVASKHGQYIKLQQIDLDFMTPTDFTFLKSNLLKEKSEFPVNLEPKPNKPTKRYWVYSDKSLGSAGQKTNVWQYVGRIGKKSKGHMPSGIKLLESTDSNFSPRNVYHKQLAFPQKVSVQPLEQVLTTTSMYTIASTLLLAVSFSASRELIREIA
ncbi:hypothetical protein RRG08_065046 [Elysia crispata]|uniref:Uncharacterized protein n=1 Tax=Elysia crispata TaxID=231223 RepID=A0AAE0ZKM7_9GAST|nr:hypothetical protein RRG08_065046 [Elysia crispata]